MLHDKTSEYILSKDGSNLTSIIKILHIICYILALILALIVLDLVLTKSSITVFILIIFIGTLSLEQDSLYWGISLVKRKKLPITGITKDSKLLPIKFKWYIYGLIGFRFILFNSLYKMFPLFLISLPIIMVGCFIGCVGSSSDGWSILTVVGFLLALFRYYVSSKEKAAMSVIEDVKDHLNSLVASTITPVSFMDYVKDKFILNTEDVKFMRSRYTNDEYIDNYFEKISRLLKENNLEKQIRLSKPTIHFAIPQESHADMTTFFSHLEMSYLNSRTKHRLREMYDSYFLIYCPGEMIAEIRRNYDLQEIGRIVLSNINLLDDCQSILTKFSLFNQLWEQLGGEKIIINESASNNKKTHAEYLPEVISLVLQSITQDMFGDFVVGNSKNNNGK